MNLQIPECKKDKKRIVLVLAVTMIICLLLQGCEKKKNMTEYERYVEKAKDIVRDVWGSEEISKEEYEHAKKMKSFTPGKFLTSNENGVYFEYKAEDLGEFCNDYDGKLVNQFYFKINTDYNCGILIKEFMDSETSLECLKMDKEGARSIYSEYTDIDFIEANMEVGYSEGGNCVQLYYHCSDIDDELYKVCCCIDNIYIVIRYYGYKDSDYRSDVICVLERMGLGTPDELEMVGGWTGRRF